MDDGGSSGRLRRAYRVPAPGDVRRCLLALSECGDDLRTLFGFLVMNAMTEPGESEGLTASQHLEVIRRHAPGLPVHDVLLNTTPVPEGVLARYAATGAAPVRNDVRAFEALGCRPVLRGLLEDAPKVRHDPPALAAALLETAFHPALASAPAQRGY
jgi:2-phospho-L-lactate transferase/gluconeogenesis factor (CofD/UPF0052 family)